MSIALDRSVLAHAIELRREIHRYPELGFEEERTAALVERELDELAITHRRVAGTGVVGVVHGERRGAVAALRADMDALPIEERSGEPFASLVAGKMHACGHDAHTAMLLAAARLLQLERERLAGTTVLIFQPAEEGPGGALPMIEAGVLDEPAVEAIAMLHVDSRLATGTIGILPGVCNAAADEFRIEIEGVGGHGAAPHSAVDAIPAAAATVLALQNLAARETDPFATLVVTIGTINGGYRNNVIADRVTMTGTFRTQDRALRDGLEARARRIVEGVAAAYGTRARLDVVYGYPPVRNDPALAESLRAFLEHTSALTLACPAPTMGGEDFAYFAERVPAVLVRLGIRNERLGAIHPGHSPKFRIDEAALGAGIETLVAFARGVGEGAITV
ncbi:MAG: M20 metallopeptidase family protein [Vulcanimicrobiaceae bacterium]